MSAILRSPITWILVTLGIASGVGLQKTRTKRKTKTKKRKTNNRKYLSGPYKGQKVYNRKTPLKANPNYRYPVFKKKRGTYIQTRKAYTIKKKKSKGKRGKRPSKATFSKMIRNNSRFTKAQKDRMIRNYRG